MREAVQSEFLQIVGKDSTFCFSGWSAELTEPELAVIENRLPSEAHYAEWLVRNAAPELLEALQDALIVLDHSGATSGYCMCGDPIESHGMGSGHSPVDSHSYVADAAITKARAAIARAKGGE